MPCYEPKVLIPSETYKLNKKGEYYHPMLLLDVNQFDKVSYQFALSDDIIESVVVPCGKCEGCRMDHARYWANRMTMETISQKKFKEVYKPKTVDSILPEFETWFITLTYDNDHLPVGDWVCNSSGDQVRYGTLSKKHVQDFLKRLRINLHRIGWEEPILFYNAGEYGETTFRPHYHMIIWNMPIYDIEQIGKTENGFPLFKSKFIEDTWTHGHVTIAVSNWNTCAYTARYCTKKAGMSGDEFSAAYDNMGIQKPFQSFSAPKSKNSKTHCLGMLFYEENKEKIYLHDKIILPPVKQGEDNKIRPPRIFDTRYREEYPDDFARVQFERKEAFEVMQNNLKSRIDNMQKYFEDNVRKQKNAYKLLNSFRKKGL